MKKIVALTMVAGMVLVAYLYGATIAGYLDMLVYSSAPSNPDSAHNRLYMTSTGLVCVTSTGASCMPAGGTTLALKVNGAANAIQTLLNLVQGAGVAITDNGNGSVTIGDPLIDSNGNLVLTTSGASGVLGLSGATSGMVALSVPAAANNGGSAVTYLFPNTIGVAGQFLEDIGAGACPTLPGGAPTQCHVLSWASPTANSALQQGVYLMLTNNDAVTGNAWGPISWDTLVNDNSGGVMWQSAHPTRLVAPATGTYLIDYAAVGSISGRFGCAKNGTVTGTTNWLIDNPNNPARITFHVQLTSGDYVECGGWGYGSTQTFTGGNGMYEPETWISFQRAF
jgi:hypothetical protein